MTFLKIFSPVLYILPEELTLRDFSSSEKVGYVLFVSFVLISIAKLFRSDVYRVIYKSNFKIKNVNVFLKENFTLSRPEVFILIFNFFISSGLILYILFDFPKVSFNQQFLFVILGSLLLFLFSLSRIVFASVLFGAYKTLRQLVFFRIIGAQYLGVIYMVIVAFWLFTNQSNDSFLIVFVVVTVLEYFVRVLKSVISVLQKKVSWYYIILYFCTIEILPFVFLMYYLQGVFELD